MTYDDWKLAGPPEYKEDAPPAQPQAIHEEPQGPCPHGWSAWRMCQWCVVGVNPPSNEEEPDVAF